MIRALMRCAAVSVVLCATYAARAQQPWSLQLSAEAGVGLRNVDLPRDGVVYQIRTGLYPALGLAFQLEHALSERFSLGLVARYQSSIGLVLREQLTGGVEHARKTRSHHAEVALASRLQVSSSGWALTAALGYSILELDPENHLLTPSYHLAGPFARVGVSVPLGVPSLLLQLAPEAQLSLQVGDELKAHGASARGLSVGGSAAIELRLAQHWQAAVTYRELHCWLDVAQASRFSDVVRVATVQLRGQL